MKIYKNRYQARKADPRKVCVKVEGGYTLMTYAEYQTWKRQK